MIKSVENYIIKGTEIRIQKIRKPLNIGRIKFYGDTFKKSIVKRLGKTNIDFDKTKIYFNILVYFFNNNDNAFPCATLNFEVVLPVGLFLIISFTNSVIIGLPKLVNCLKVKSF